MLILNLFKPLSRLAEVLFGKELLSFFLDDNSIDVSKSQISRIIRFLDHKLLLEFFKVMMAVNFQIRFKLGG